MCVFLIVFQTLLDAATALDKHMTRLDGNAKAYASEIELRFQTLIASIHKRREELLTDVANHIRVMNTGENNFRINVNDILVAKFILVLKFNHIVRFILILRFTKLTIYSSLEIGFSSQKATIFLFIFPADTLKQHFWNQFCDTFLTFACYINVR